MGRSKKREPEDILIGFRVSKSMKQSIDDAAKEAGAPVAEWLREAVIEKIERESGINRNASQILSDPEALDQIMDALGDKLQPMIEGSVKAYLNRLEEKKE